MIALLAVGLALPALAQEKKKGEKPPPNFDDLFGAPADKNSAVDKMKKASEGVGSKTNSGGLAPKAATIDGGNAEVKFLNVFAAETIITDKKLGCQPGGRDKKKLAFWTFDEVPAKGAPFEVCLTISATGVGREMNMSVAVVDARNQRVARAEDVIDFRGRSKIDHVLAYPAPVFKGSGQYFYVIDLDGKEAGRLPLFVVNTTGETSGPNLKMADEPAGGAPVTAKEPDGT